MELSLESGICSMCFDDEIDTGCEMRDVGFEMRDAGCGMRDNGC